jgi:hypothetical protein
MAPDLPIGFVQREKEFDQLRSFLLDPDRRGPVAITTALTGAGGFGKTTLAAALCHDDAILQAFGDGILWVTLGETPNLADALAQLYAGLTGERPGIAALEADYAYASNQPELMRLGRLLRNASHVLAAQTEQLLCQLLARWPTELCGKSTSAAARRLRQQAIAQLQQAGGACPLSASLLGSEALLLTACGRGNRVTALAVLPGGQLASGAGDRTIRLCDPASVGRGGGQLIFVADAAITALAFLSDASILVAGDAGGRLHWLRLPGR